MYLKNGNKQCWLNLYAAADKFKQLAPWQWMNDERLFAVETRGEHEIAYCCIMGGLGEVFGINVYLGSKGLVGHYKNIDFSTNGGDPNETLLAQNCLLVTFEDKEALSADDIGQIKELGLKYKGRNEWPLFRECTPGWYPWYLSEQQAVYLTTVLEQAIVVAEKVKEDPAILDNPDKETSTGETYFSRKEKEEAGRTIWEDSRLSSGAGEEISPLSDSADKEIEKITKHIFGYPLGRYELDCFVVPMFTPVMDEKAGRPYFPLCILWAAHDNKMILHFQLCKMEDGIHAIASSLLEEIKKRGAAPAQIVVPDKETCDIVMDTFTGRVAIPVSVSMSIQEDLERLKKSIAMGNFE